MKPRKQIQYNIARELLENSLDSYFGLESPWSENSAWGHLVVALWEPLRDLASFRAKLLLLNIAAKP